MNHVATLLTAVALLFTGLVGADASTLPPCEHEDSINCYWDAQTMGNGTGSSFTNVDGVVTYWETVETIETVNTLEAQAWLLWDAVGASQLLPNHATTVTFSGANQTGFPYLSANQITVWDAYGNHYLFTFS